MWESGVFNYIKFTVTIPFLLTLFLSENAFCHPCSDEPVTGETKSEVAAKCGEAMSREGRSVKVEETDEKGAVSSTITNIDEWIYGSGPDNLVQLFRFEDGHLVRIKNVGYGKVNDFTNDMCRDGENLAVGDDLAETFLKCGEPLAKETLKNKVIESDYGVAKRRMFVPVVEWTYRYGPNAPGYTVTFENGVAANIRVREFGK